MSKFLLACSAIILIFSVVPVHIQLSQILSVGRPLKNGELYVVNFSLRAFRFQDILLNKLRGAVICFTWTFICSGKPHNIHTTFRYSEVWHCRVQWSSKRGRRHWQTIFTWLNTERTS